MYWKNLKENLCPHCGKLLAKRDDDNEIVCTFCKFHIDKQRFDMIIKHRCQDGGKVQKIKWQNLHEDKCPLCSANLKTDDFFRKRCTKEGCTFLVTKRTLDEIFNDTSHPANRYWKPEWDKNEIYDI